jgi:midasin (ATPase involved in ribosome maturation)
MKTWMFTTAVFWMFYNMCVCPQSNEQTTLFHETAGGQTTITDLFSQRWHLSRCIRPPPLRI